MRKALGLALLLAAGAPALPIGLFQGELVTLTRAQLFLPGTEDGGYPVVVRNEIDESFNVVVRGGTGMGVLLFEAYLLGADYFAEHEMLHLHDAITAPFELWPNFSGPLNAPAECWAFGCGIISFTYNVPFGLQFAAYSDANYHANWPAITDPIITGNFKAETRIRLIGVGNYDPNEPSSWELNPNAQIIATQIPEPSTLSCVALALLSWLLLRKKSRPQSQLR